MVCFIQYLYFLIATLVTPILLVFFLPHRLLYRFDDNLFVDMDSGHIQTGPFLAQFVIQIAFLVVTYIFIIFIEAKYNGVDLRFATAQRNILQEISQVYYLKNWQ